MNDLHSPAHAYVVGALTTGETDEFESHLDECGDCRREVAEMREVTSELSRVVALDPPVNLRGSVLAKIADTPQEQLAATAGPVRVGDQAPGAMADVVQLRRPRTTMVTSLLAAAAVLAAIAFGGLAFQSRQAADDATAQREQLTALLSAPDVRTVLGQSAMTTHTGTVLMSARKHVALFVTSDLPALPGDKVYEAWTIQDGDDPAPAGTFTPDGSQSVLQLTDAAFDADRLAITVEPSTGSQQPTTEAVISVDMT